MVTEIKSYWDNSGKFQNLATQLEKLVPVSGKVDQPRKNSKLEKFRTASNAYYDIFNNGGCNRYHEIRYHFNLTVRQFTYGHRTNWVAIQARVDPIMDQIVINAAIEQGLIQSEEEAIEQAAIEQARIDAENEDLHYAPLLA